MRQKIVNCEKIKRKESEFKIQSYIFCYIWCEMFL